jgi:hypothetical protein
VNSGAPEGYVVPAPLVAPVVNVHLRILIYLCFRLSDPYLWVACITSGHDGLLYSYVCKQLAYWKRFGSLKDIPVQKGKPGCAMFNTSNTLQMYTYGDCLEKHPFIVIKRGMYIDTIILTMGVTNCE